jgi:hypothetical protein
VPLITRHSECCLVWCFNKSGSKNNQGTNKHDNRHRNDVGSWEVSLPHTCACVCFPSECDLHCVVKMRLFWLRYRICTCISRTFFDKNLT